ncbi:unnamed protein product [Heligmosomoides polygyrus]|uniref:Macro domain-containing protein n=1 Tax=Heligmosomoides polygyrus TaxID=6339 RepID=A0A183GAZ1_HELPZ|nr:unnamed protein product [Heligmosomoides polygyrus]
MSLDLQQDHLVSCTAQKSTLLRSSASTNSHERPVKVPTFNVATRVLLTLRDFRTTSVAHRCRPGIRDPRILLTLAGLCECASAPADTVALSRKLLDACIQMSVFGSARRSKQFPVAPRGGTDLATGGNTLETTSSQGQSSKKAMGGYIAKKIATTPSCNGGIGADDIRSEVAIIRKNGVTKIVHGAVYRYGLGSSTSLSAPIVNEADHGEYAPKIKELTEAVMKAAGTLCIHQLTDPTFRGRLAHGRD